MDYSDFSSPASSRTIGKAIRHYENELGVSTKEWRVCMDDVFRVRYDTITFEGSESVDYPDERNWCLPSDAYTLTVTTSSIKSIYINAHILLKLNGKNTRDDLMLLLAALYVIRAYHKSRKGAWTSYFTYEAIYNQIRYIVASMGTTKPIVTGDDIKAVLKANCLGRYRSKRYTLGSADRNKRHSTTMKKVSDGKMKSFIEAHPDMSVRELAAISETELGVKVSKDTIARALKRIGVSVSGVSHITFEAHVEN